MLVADVGLGIVFEGVDASLFAFLDPVELLEYVGDGRGEGSGPGLSEEGSERSELFVAR